MIIQSAVRTVEKYVRNHQSQYINELSFLCSIDSGSYCKAGLDEMARYIKMRMDDLGMNVTVFEQEEWGNDVLGVIHGTGKGNVLLLGHMDTVYPVGTAAIRPVRVEDNIVSGPGVCDMKGGLLCAFYAIEALLKINCLSFGELRFLCVSDEELGIRHSRELIRQASQDCHRALVLEAARDNGKLVSARKGGAWYKLIARGYSAHAGVEPGKGSSAVLELAHQILQFQSLNGWRDGLTINPSIVSSGTTSNVVPDYAEVEFDLRFLQNTDKIETLERWHELMQRKLVPNVELTLEAAPNYRDPMVCTPECLEIVHQAQEIANQLNFSIDHEATGGISDANYIANYGVPVLDGLGPIGGLDHSPDEYILADSIVPRTALLAGLIISTGI